MLPLRESRADRKAERGWILIISWVDGKRQITFHKDFTTRKLAMKLEHEVRLGDKYLRDFQFAFFGGPNSTSSTVGFLDLHESLQCRRWLFHSCHRKWVKRGVCQRPKKAPAASAALMPPLRLNANKTNKRKNPKKPTFSTHLGKHRQAEEELPRHVTRQQITSFFSWKDVITFESGFIF